MKVANVDCCLRMSFSGQGEQSHKLPHDCGSQMKKSATEVFIT